MKAIKQTNTVLGIMCSAAFFVPGGNNVIICLVCTTCLIQEEDEDLGFVLDAI